ncbi:MAG: aminoglycoside phosphotransferase family protein [Mogibacterium sp.]|nr:aminoglycoside phosphotransferase family protein [Mogibacterium sp.]MBR0342947.1 aminoglycoside phosphotransferase family protein [Oscillospiraceae bacterium]
MKYIDLKPIAEKFNIEGAVLSAAPTGNGHINDTYLVVTDSAKYILQRINTHVFRSPDQLMHNIKAVTEFMRSPLQVITTRDGGLFTVTQGGHWRMMTCIENSYSCEQVDDPEQFCEIGRAYGSFIHELAGFPARNLFETIEGFHDTRRRFEQLMRACEADPVERKKTALEEVRFACEREKDTDVLNDCVRRGEIPVRVTHNDTKINNVLLDRDTGKAVCVIDLDTVMPGLAINDFGDAIRSGASTGREDEDDSGQVRLDVDLYRSYAEGFLAGCPDMTEKEIELMPVGARLMTLECGIRFLTDYIEGDHYFKTDYPEHNLVRCRAQFRLVQEMEEHL